MQATGRPLTVINTSYADKKILSVFITLTIFGLSSCGPKIDIKNFYGTWGSVFDPEVDIPGQKQQVTFTSDGKYKVIISNKDSVINSFDGTFEVNAETNTINMTNEGWTLKDMTVIKLTATEMRAEVSEEQECRYTLIYRRQ